MSETMNVRRMAPVATLRLTTLALGQGIVGIADERLLADAAEDGTSEEVFPRSLLPSSPARVLDKQARLLPVLTRHDGGPDCRVLLTEMGADSDNARTGDDGLDL